MTKILITGDFCPIGRTTDLALKGDHHKIFNDFLSFINEADLAITNLECPLIPYGKPIKKTGPALKAPVENIQSLKYAGFNLVTLANNHIMDYGEKGLHSTIEACTDSGIDTVGAGTDLTMARTPFVKEINGIKIAVLNFSENEFSTTAGNEAGANPLALPKNFQDIKSAKENADYVIVVFHGGNEMYQLPSPRIKEIFRFYVDAGADCVIGHHTHCYSGHEKYNKANIFYGLGNFIFDLEERAETIWYEGMAILLEIDSLDSISFEMIPYVQNDDKPGVWLAKNEKKQKMEKRLENLNNIIANDLLLEEQFLQFVSKKSKQYQNYLEPFSTKLIRFLRRKRLFPSLLSRQKKLLYLNLVRCEAHRDVVLEILKGK